MRYLMYRLAIFIAFFGCTAHLNSQVVLKADGPGNTYELINSVLAPGANAVESPDTFDPAFGRHITEVWDADLNQYVFEFNIHVSVPNEFQDISTGDTDRQRLEIKTYASSPANLKGVPGETIEYKWRFKIPTGFQPSSNFTHIHQIKAVGGDESDPIFTLTCRKGTPNKLELNYYSNSNLSQIKFTSVDLTQFENNWVEATEKIKVDSLHGSYSMSISKVSDGTKLLTYSNPDLLTFRSTNTFIRPKWGIYRSLLTYQDLRDEAVRFNNFSIYELPTTGVNTPNVSLGFTITRNKNEKKLNLQLNSTFMKDAQLEILNINGQGLKRLISAESGGIDSFRYSTDISDLKSGVYILRLWSDNECRAQKFIIND